MYCTKCGAVVIGKYCSVCGQRVRSEMEEYKLLKRRAEREYKRVCTQNGHADLYTNHIANACWLAALAKYEKRPDEARWSEVIASLDKIDCTARALFDKLKDF